MIVQTAPEGASHLVITQIDHARACEQLATAFGNTDFAPLEPHDAMVYVIGHHDEGWAMVDATQKVDPKTHLPYHLTQTPILRLIATGNGSPDFNEDYHPYSGLLSSMHTWGLYHGRYGLSDKIFINSFPAEYRAEVDAMLAREEARQKRLKAQLAQHTEFAPWVEEAHLMHNYKLLQFFDTLALYFHTTHVTQRQTSTFLNVPQSVGQDVSITITPLSNSGYRLSPFPFNENMVSFATVGYPLPLLDNDASVATAFANTAPVTETVYLVR